MTETLPIGEAYRTWTCGCGHIYEAKVTPGPTPNTSGEITQWCPKCGKRPRIGTPWHRQGEYVETKNKVEG